MGNQEGKYTVWKKIKGGVSVSLLFCTLFFCSLVHGAQVENSPSWQSNYMNPGYFEAKDSNFITAKQGPQYFESEEHNEKIHCIDPYSSEVSGYLIEIHNKGEGGNLNQISEKFFEYAMGNQYPIRRITVGSSSVIYFFEKLQEFNSKIYYEQFGKLVTWLLLNREDSRVSVRSILKNKATNPFDPDRVIWMESVIVRRTTTGIKDPSKEIIDGFHIHVDYLPGQEEKAFALFEVFKRTIADKEIIYSALDSYPEKSNGPHVRAGWEIKFEKKGPCVFDQFGFSLAWLLLNHGEVPVYSHAKTWIYGENEERLISHLDYALYMGAAPKLDQWFFFHPENSKTGLYRWDSQLPTKRTVTQEESMQKQQEILGFWFGETDEEYPYEMSKLWFVKQNSSGHSNFDQMIFEKFQKDIVLASMGSYDDWKKSPKGRLALILLFDQFPRNMYRGTGMAYAYDTMSRKIAREGIDRGEDRELSFAERLFFYLPLEHSENMGDQLRSVKLMEELKEDAPDFLKEKFEVHFRMAERHKQSVEQFGRFPWRNQVLGRDSTSEEDQYLSSPDNHF